MQTDKKTKKEASEGARESFVLLSLSEHEVVDGSSSRSRHDSSSINTDSGSDWLYTPMSPASKLANRKVLKQKLLARGQEPPIQEEAASMDDSRTGIEVDMHATRLPMQQEEAKKHEVDLHAAESVEKREDFFQQILPGHFQIIKPLGRGYNGVVYAAKEKVVLKDNDEETTGEREVAIKFLEQRRAGQVDRRLREIAALAFVPPHQNIVRLLSTELLSAGGYEYFVMELCDSSLDTWIANIAKERDVGPDPNGVLPPALTHEEAFRLLHELCDALLTLRQFGVAHRDIKPSNILLCAKTNGSVGDFQFTAKLADFGVADLQVGKAARRYDTFIGVVADSDTAIDAPAYSSNDDFRAAVASVLFAWLGESQWADKLVRTRLFSDKGFEHAMRQLALHEPDKDVRDVLERALPSPRIQKRDEVLFLDGCLDCLESMGTKYGLHPKLEKRTLVGNAGFNVSESSDLTSKKLETLGKYALSAISGRRYAKDFSGAHLYLEWVRFVFKKYTETGEQVPDQMMMDFHYQSFLSENSPELQDRIRKYVNLVGAESATEKYTDLAQEIEKMFVKAEERILQGRSCFVRLAGSKEDFSSSEHTGFANLQALLAVERIKYLVARNELDEAARLTKTQAANLRYVMEIYEEYKQGRGQVFVCSVEEDEAQGRVSFRCCRNAYLLLREAINIAKRQNQLEEQAHLASEAIDLCQLGLRYIESSPKARKEDILEMGRCLAEALFVAGQFQKAREQSRIQFERYFEVTALRRNLMRVCSIWIASLRQLVASAEVATSNEASFELGFVSCFMTLTHRVEAQALAKEPSTVSNARYFLATEPAEALAAAGAGQILPIPLLPPNELISNQAMAATEALKKELKRKANK